MFDAALDFASRSRFALARFQYLTPYPGTRIYERFLAEGRVELEYWLDPTWERRLVFRPRNMSAEDLLRSIKRIRKAYYSSGAIVRRAAAKNRRAYDLPLNLLYRGAMRSRSAALS